jgi:hypothetical protein
VTCSWCEEGKTGIQPHCLLCCPMAAEAVKLRRKIRRMQNKKRGCKRWCGIRRAFGDGPRCFCTKKCRDRGSIMGPSWADG